MAGLNNMQIMQFPGKYIQGPGAINFVPKLMDEMGGNNFVLSTKSMFEKCKDVFGNKATIEKFSGEACIAEISRIKKLAAEVHATSIAAVGGGKVIDTAKIAADELNIPVICCPTIASTDAPTSGCAVVYTEEGCYVKVAYQKHNPDVVVMDTEILIGAPVRFLVSGMGDAMATYLEAYSCNQSDSPSECIGGGLRTKTALAMAKLCMDMLFQYGEQAKADAEAQKVTEAFTAIVEANTLLSGIGFESNGIAMCHAIHNALTLLPNTHRLFHGEKVAFGCVSLLEMYDPLGVRDKVMEFFVKVGLPVTFSDLNIPDVTDEELLMVAEETARPDNFSHHEPFEFDTKMVFNAMKAADNRGKDFKSKNL